MSLAARLLFDLCFLLSLGLATFVYRKDSKARLNRYFALAALALFAWLYTLYLYDGGGVGDFLSLTELGRLNYAAVLYVALLGYMFVAELIGKPPRKILSRLILAETVALTLATLATPLIDVAEVSARGQGASTIFGPLFPIYVLHVSTFLGAGVVSAAYRMRTAAARLRRQLATVVLGMLVSAALGLMVDVFLPFARHDFRFENLGALAAVIYFVSMAYAITAEHLFDVRLVIRRAFVLTALVALGVELYDLVLDWLVRYLPVSNSSDRRLLATALVLTHQRADPRRGAQAAQPGVRPHRQSKEAERRRLTNAYVRRASKDICEVTATLLQSSERSNLRSATSYFAFL